VACPPQRPPDPPESDEAERLAPVEPVNRTEDPRASDRAYRTCPACGAELADVGCRLRCPTPDCGYFLSCSDFY
jgi:hypothetical protein